MNTANFIICGLLNRIEIYRNVTKDLSLTLRNKISLSLFGIEFDRG